MRSFLHLWSRFLFFVVSVSMITGGVLLLLTVLQAPLVITWSILAIALTVLLIGGNRFGAWQSLRNFLSRIFSGPQPPKTGVSSATLEKPLKLVGIHFRLSDPVEPHAFDQFLDMPLFTWSMDNHVSKDPEISARYAVESSVFEYAERLERKYHGQLLVEVDIREGSLVVVMTLLATTYSVLAQYHDVFESIALMRRQLQRTFDVVSNTYKSQTEREVVVESKTTWNRRPTKRQNPSKQATEEASSSIEPVIQPYTITNTISPPSAHHDYNINVNVPSSDSQVSGCLAFLFWIFFWSIFCSIVLGVVFCYQGENATLCNDWYLWGTKQLIDLLSRIGGYLIDLSERMKLL